MEVHVWTYQYSNGGKPGYMTLNNYFPSYNGGLFAYANFNQTIANTSNVLWAPLMEKALAVIYGNTYTNLTSGGAEGALGFLAGGQDVAAIPEFTYGPTGPATIDYVYNFSNQGVYISQINDPSYLLTVGSWSTNDGFVAGHDYAVLNTWKDRNGTQWIQLFNPWGFDEPPPITYSYLTTSGNFSADGYQFLGSAASSDVPSDKQTNGIVPIVVSNSPVRGSSVPDSSGLVLPAGTSNPATGANLGGQADIAYGALSGNGHAPKYIYAAEALAVADWFDGLDGLDTGYLVGRRR